MIDRGQALELLAANTPEPHLLHHALQTEAVLRALARRLERDENLWGLAGLLHDVDYAATKDAPERHGLEGAAMLGDQLPEEALAAIRAHNGMTGETPTSELDFALRCGETVTGLVSAAALVRPTRMEGMKPKSLKKKMKDKAFARGVDRGIIMECERLDLELGEFLQLAIDAVNDVAGETGLA